MDLLALLLLIHSRLVLIMEGHSALLTVTMIHLATIVHYKLAMLKAMEDGGTIIAGILMSTSIIILHGMDSSTFLALGTIRGG